MSLNFNKNAEKAYWISCDHEGARVVFRRYKNGKPRFREWCDKCGNFTEDGYAGCGLEKAVKRYGRDRVYEAQTAQGLNVRPKRPDHAEYIQSEQWFDKRAEIMLRANGRCEIEGCSREARQVHHLHYRTLGNERPQDLLAVCIECHEAIHHGS